MEERLFLSIRVCQAKLVCVVLLGMVVLLIHDCYAQAPQRGKAVLVGIKKSDRVGPQRAYPDGKPDLVFSLSLPKSQRTVTDVGVTATGGPPGRWHSRKVAKGSKFLGVADAKRPSLILSAPGKPLEVELTDDTELLLFATDDGHATHPSRSYQVTISFADGKSANVPVGKETAVTPAAPKPDEAVYPVRMSCILKGISNYDAVGLGKTIRGDNVADGLFILSIEADNKILTAIEIRNIDGRASVWDTVPASGNSPIGVARVSEPVRLLNDPNGSVRVSIKRRVDLNLYVADNGSIEEGRTHYRVSVTFGDGSISWCPVNAAPKAREDGAELSPPTKPRARFRGTWLGYVSTDAVGPTRALKPDTKADAVFGLDIEVTPRSYITGIEINSLVNPSTKWATGKVSPNAWALGVAYQNAPTKLLNRTDGSVKIPIDGRRQFNLYAADPGNLGARAARLRIVVHLADGSSYQQMVQTPAASTTSVVPGTDVAKQAKGLITCEFRGFIADLVNKSNRPGKDDFLDGTFILRLHIQDKIIAKVELTGTEGEVRWSSRPRPGKMFLGVAVYPNIYKFVNSKGGNLGVEVSGRKTLYLYAADNGLLSDPTSQIGVIVTFTDKTTLSTSVIK